MAAQHAPPYHEKADDLTLYVHNGRGAINKILELLQDACVGDGPMPDIMMFQEANISEDNADRILGDVPQGWAAGHSAKPSGHMSGVLTIIRTGVLLGSNTRIEPVMDVSNPTLDLLALKIRNLLIVNVYLHITKNKNRLEVIQDVIEHVSDLLTDHPGCQMIIGGDFNCPHHWRQLIENMEALDMFAVLPCSNLAEPTHFRGGVLDWIFTSSKIKTDPLTILKRGEDHFPLKTYVSVPLDKETKVLKYSFNWKGLPDIQKSPEKHSELMAAVLGATKGVNISEYRDRLLNDVLPKFLGTKVTSGRSIPRSWYEQDISLARRVYRATCRRYHNHPTPENREEMRAAHKAYQRAMRKRRHQAKAEMARKVGINHYSIYKLVTSKKGQGSQSRFIPNMETLLEFWTTQFNHDDALQHGWWDNKTFEAGLNGKIPAVAFTADQVQEAFAQMKTKKAPGDDDIRVALFKGAPKELYEELARMFTEMVNVDEPLPTWMKQSVGKLLYKQKGPRKDPSNYRVIVMAPLFAKIFEKMLENWGRRLVDQGVLKIAEEQGGFMPGRSTHDSVFLLLSLRDAQIRRGKKMYACFLDIRKAFDSVDHKIFLQHMRDTGAPEEWIRLLAKMLEERQLKLFDALIELKVGTVQGSPVSPLLFVLFINPMIQRLKDLGKGINLLRDDENMQRVISSLLFADDTCLVAESLGDLRDMLEVCSSWAKDFGMKFNASKSELLQLAGKIPRVRTTVTIDGEKIPWIKEVKYLGIVINEGKRRRHAAPTAKMWKAYHRVKGALTSGLPLPIRDQLLLIQADILSIALYPSPVVKMDYNTIDRFINRVLCRITGCQQRWTSATFLRAELGLPSSRYLADYRALSYYWHLSRETWFHDLLPMFQGTTPLQRIVDMAQLYGIDLDTVRNFAQSEWKGHVKAKIMEAAEEHMNVLLLNRRYPYKAEPFMRMRPYIRNGGSHARYGLKFRWERIRRSDKRFVRSNEVAVTACEECNGSHGRQLSSFKDLMSDCANIVPARHRKIRDEAIQAIIQDISGEDLQAFGTPLRLRLETQLKDAVETLSWPRCSNESLGNVLDMFARVIKSQERRSTLNAG